MISDYEIFKGKSLSALFKDIYKNSKKNKEIIQDLVAVLATHIKNTQDAVAIIPSIKEFLEVDVKNDEQLVKLAKVVQQLIAHESSNKESETISGNDRQKLLDEMRKKAAEGAFEINQNNDNLESQIEEISKNALIPEA